MIIVVISKSFPGTVAKSFFNLSLPNDRTRFSSESVFAVTNAMQVGVLENCGRSDGPGDRKKIGRGD